MTIKAEWRLAELDLTSDDPFDAVVLSSGLTVDLTGDEREIHDGLRQTLEIESRLFNGGVTCDLKDGGQDCLVCPEFTSDSFEPRAPLCQLGRDQRQLLQRAEAFQRQRFRPYAVIGAACAFYSEVAERYASYTAVAV